MRFEQKKDWRELCSLYDVYKDCLYEPSEEKYEKKLKAYLEDAKTGIYVCIDQGEIKGMTVISLSENGEAEICGIAVSRKFRGFGIGSFMIDKIGDIPGVSKAFAETDDDSVGFYRKKGFSIKRTEKIYDGLLILRYECTRRYR